MGLAEGWAGALDVARIARRRELRKSPSCSLYVRAGCNLKASWLDVKMLISKKIEPFGHGNSPGRLIAVR